MSDAATTSFSAPVPLSLPSLDLPSLSVPVYAPVTDEAAHQPTAQERAPRSAATLTVRVIKSFEFRTMKALVLRGLDLETVTVGELKGRCREGELVRGGGEPYGRRESIGGTEGRWAGQVEGVASDSGTDSDEAGGKRGRRRGITSRQDSCSCV